MVIDPPPGVDSWRTSWNGWTVVLEEYAPTVPGFFLCFPSRAQSSASLRFFIEVAKEIVKKAP